MISMYPAGLVLIGVRQQGQEACTPDGELQLALVVSTRPRDAARNDLAGLGDIALERGQILVVDLLDVIGRESAELFSAKKTCHVGLLCRAPQRVPMDMSSSSPSSPKSS